MKQDRNEQAIDFDRRSFLKSSSFSTLMMMMGGVALRAEDKPAATPSAGDEEDKYAGPPVNCGVIGCGVWGRKLAETLATLPNAPVVAICDTYQPFLRRSKEAAPKAESYTDYRKLLESKDVKAVFVATPTHQHKQIVLDALQAGKHVYCEAPLANNIEDARTIAKAAKNSLKLNFQPGLQFRADKHRHFLVGFIRAGAMGKPIRARAQWNKKQSWRRPAATPEREKEINWRLEAATSLGIAGEIGIHQIDVVNWFLNRRPTSVVGLGSIVQWADGREVPDTIQAVFEYPNGVSASYESTLANSFDSEYEMFYGTDSAVMLRQNKAWMFKEVDAPTLGWEVYARKDEFYKETGIALAADATKLSQHGAKAGDETAAAADAPLLTALKAFIANTNGLSGGVEDFIAGYGDTPKALKEYLASIAKDRLPAPTADQGFEATVIAIKTNEAIAKGQKITFQNEWFEV